MCVPAPTRTPFLLVPSQVRESRSYEREPRPELCGQREIEAAIVDDDVRVHGGSPLRRARSPRDTRERIVAWPRGEERCGGRLLSRRLDWAGVMKYDGQPDRAARRRNHLQDLVAGVPSGTIHDLLAEWLTRRFVLPRGRRGVSVHHRRWSRAWPCARTAPAEETRSSASLGARLRFT